MLPIEIKHIRYNYTNSGTKKIYIVVHDTGNTARGGDDVSHYIYFNGAVRNASAHYFVDKDSITETVDPNKDSWHCGDGAGKYGITNSNSIGVEICINADGNYEMAVNNALELVAYLMKRFGIDLAHVVRHYDASRKNCPATMSANNWAKWTKFKNRLGGNTVASTELAKGTNSYAVKDLQMKLNELGYNCGIADGDFGTNTYNAVISFQNAKGLSADGIVGNTTMNAINNAITIKNTPKLVIAPAPVPTVASKAVYRVRLVWEDVKSQLGAYSDIDGAKAVANKNTAYSVFDDTGKLLYKYTAPVVPVPPVIILTLEERIVILEEKVKKLIG